MTAGYLFCTENHCNWIGREVELLKAPNPFDPEETLTGCPLCRGVNTMLDCCDEPECFEYASCGTPTPTGYRRTCHKHMPKF